MNDDTITRDAGLRVAVFGPTGVAGSGVLRACLAAPEVASIVAVTRRPLGLDSGKLRAVLCADFTDLRPVASAFVDLDACFYCLGISVSQVSAAEYRTITYTYALEAARAMKEASPDHTFHFVSGSGTRVGSRLMWARVKGETEEALKGAGLAGALCWRPAMILGDRLPGGLAWPYRALYPVMRLLAGIPSLSVRAESIGDAMIETQLEGRREGTIHNLEIRSLAERYRARQR